MDFSIHSNAILAMNLGTLINFLEWWKGVLLVFMVLEVFWRRRQIKLACILIWWFIESFAEAKCNRRQLFLPPLIWNVSQFMILLLELLGQAIGCLAGPSSSKRKIMNWEIFQISGGKNNCLLLPVLSTYTCLKGSTATVYDKKGL